jgi:hypothetical protein
MLCPNWKRLHVPYLSSSYSGNFSATSFVVAPGLKASIAAFKGSQHFLYTSFSSSVGLLLPHLKVRTKSQKYPHEPAPAISMITRSPS